MSQALVRRLERFRKKQKLSISAVCKLMDTSRVNYHRWKKTKKIHGPYEKVIEAFLDKNEAPQISSSASTLPQSRSDIAVIGIACYYPGASNVKELWENILTRRVQFRRMLDQRLPLSKYYDSDPKAPEKTYLTKAAFIENYQFDWGKLRIPKKTVESTDIVHWLALDMALKTFADAGYKLNEIPLQNTGVIVGNTLTGEQTRSQSLRLRWPYVQGVVNATLNHLGIGSEGRGRIVGEMEQIYKSAFYPITEDSLAGGLANTIAGRICNYLNLKGGGYIVDGACSSSLLAVATAANALKMGDMDLALAGGVDISLDPFELVGFAKVGALAKDKMSVYDQSANGFLPGEGCGFVLLKRLADAIKDKNYVYAVVKGWGISSDGKGGIMEPSSSGQSFAIGRAYKNLPYKIADVDFVEGHGTGTTKGDRVELEGIATAIEQTVSKENKNKRTCGVTSFKSIVGHTKAAAGIGGLIKAILAVNQRILPPTASCITPNEVFKDKAKNLYPLIQGRLLDSKKIARAGISSAGFGGINCHVTIESKDEPKKELKPKIDERALFVSQQNSEIFVFTSRSIIHLKKVIAKFKEDLRNISIAEMADLAALLNKKVKTRLGINVTIVTDSPEHLYDALVLIDQEISSTQIEEGKIHKVKANDINTYIALSNHAKEARVGFLYPGQGSQRLNMTRVLVERYKWAQDLLVLSKLPLYDHIYKATDKFFTKEEQQEFEKQLADTRITQPSIILSSLVWTEFLSRLGVEPIGVAGHSLGELIAFYKAGAFNKETLIKFAELRGQLMAAKGRMAGSMVSLFCSRQKAEEYVSKIAGNAILANINSPSQMIISGGKREIDKIIELAEKDDISIRRLNVSNAFHSSLMKPASDKILSSKVLPETFKPNGVTVYSGVNSTAIDGRVNVKEYFSKQVVSQVNFVGLVEVISKECDLLIEVGPGRVLTDLVKAINKDEGPLCLPIESSAQNDRDLNVVLAELFIRNVPVKWEELYKNRLIKVFVPASRKKFIENQCERPLRLGNQILKSEALQIASYRMPDEQQAEEIIPGGLPSVEGKDNIANLLIDLVHKLTEYKKETITLDLRLLDNLNLDSIKAAELIGQATRALGIAGQIDPSKISNNTLGQIRDQLYTLVEEKGTAGVGKESTIDILRRYQDRTWVRNFVQKVSPQEITTRNVNQFQNLKNIVLLSHKDVDVLTDDIKEHFKNAKLKIKRLHYEDIDAKSFKGNVDCLIALFPRGAEYKELDKDSFKAIIKRLNKIVSLAQSNQIEKDAFIVFVQFGGGNFGENEGLKDIASSSAKSLASTLYLERPDLKVRIVDFDKHVSDKEAFLKVIDELQTYERFNAVGYDAKLNRNVVVYENSEPAGYKKRNISWVSQDVVLVTGGAKGITAQCALAFARAIKVTMVLLGRSPLPTKDEDNEINQTLKQFDKENLKASYYQCDVSDEKNVADVIKQIEKDKGKITGVIHGAGLNSLRRLKQISVSEVLNESLPKVMGAVNVCKALSEPPKLIAAITSIIGITGMDGSGWYGLANEVLNLYLHQYKAQHPKTEVVSIAYSVWDEVGMGARLGSVKLLANKGIGAIPVQEGIKRFRQLIEYDPDAQQVIVSARLAGLDTWKSPTVRPSNFRFIENVEYILPGIELITQAQLSVQDDLYLLDHNWKGSLLFPFVFGFEAMAQAVAYVLGMDGFDYITAKDIRLEKAISVPEDLGIFIEIHAEVLEQEKANECRKVKVEIYSQETGYQSPHFSAVFEINLNPKVLEKIDQSLEKRAKESIDLDVQTDIYGPILFQGKMFQGIERIHELYYDEKTRKGECVLSSAFNKSTNTFLQESKKFNNRFLTGDPFFIDTVLQSMQLIIPQDLSLPRRIEEIAIDVSAIPRQLTGIVKSHIHKISSEQGIGNAVVYNGEQRLLEIENCDLKILQTIVERPSANDLVDPARREQRAITTKLSDLSKELGFTLPVIKCAYDGRLKGAPKEARHKIELPLIKESVEELLMRAKGRVDDFQIKWLESSKPVVVGKEVENIGVSVSHVDAFLMTMAGNGSQGCDVEIVRERTKDAWLELFGKEKIQLVDEMVRNNDQVNYSQAATLVWTIFEAVKKGVGHDNFKLEFQKLVNSVTVFTVEDSNKDYFVLAFPILLSNETTRCQAFLLKGQREIKEVVTIQDDQIAKVNFDKNVFAFDLDYSGPQGQMVFTKRFPVTFRASQRLSRKVYFPNYFEWMGEMREYGAYTILRKVYELGERDSWGMATNYIHLQVLDELEPGEIVEVRMWQESETGSNNEIIMNLKYEWKRIDGKGEINRAALSQMGFSWVKILGRGMARAEPLPKFLREFFDIMLPKKGALMSPLAPFPSRYKDVDPGKIIYKTENIIRRQNPIFTHEILTATENSNFIGNIYFANYGEWMGYVLDLYFHDLNRRCFDNQGNNGEWLCLECSVDHLSEAMPYDKILIKMFVDTIYTSALDLAFEYYLMDGDNVKRKLATGKHRMAWLASDPSNNFNIVELPKKIIESLLKVCT